MAGRPPGASIPIRDAGEKAWHPCLAPGHDHLMLTTKAIRICQKGRLEIAGIDVVYGVEDRGPIVFPRSRRAPAPTSGPAAAMVEA